MDDSGKQYIVRMQSLSNQYTAVARNIAALGNAFSEEDKKYRASLQDKLNSIDTELSKLQKKPPSNAIKNYIGNMFSPKTLAEEAALTDTIFEKLYTLPPKTIATMKQGLDTATFKLACKTLKIPESREAYNTMVEILSNMK